MAQEHFDRLTALDASFLHQEGPTSHMHVGAVTIFEGPPPPFEDVLDHVDGSTGSAPLLLSDVRALLAERDQAVARLDAT